MKIYSTHYFSDLLLVKRGANWVFARIRSPAGPAQAKHSAYLDPLEHDAEFVTHNEIMRLSPKFLSENLGSVRYYSLFIFSFISFYRLISNSLMEKLVVDPAEEFFSNLNNEIRNRSNAFLQEQGVNIPVLKRFSKNEISVSCGLIMSFVSLFFFLFLKTFSPT
jgi:hypothetical protein